MPSASSDTLKLVPFELDNEAHVAELKRQRVVRIGLLASLLGREENDEDYPS